MADCEFLAGCVFFNDKISQHTGLGAWYKKIYCQSNNTTCARYLVAKKLGREKIPNSLFPNMCAVARKLIHEGQ